MTHGPVALYRDPALPLRPRWATTDVGRSVQTSILRPAVASLASHHVGAAYTTVRTFRAKTQTVWHNLWSALCMGIQVQVLILCNSCLSFQMITLSPDAKQLGPHGHETHLCFDFRSILRFTSLFEGTRLSANTYMHLSGIHKQAARIQERNIYCGRQWHVKGSDRASLGLVPSTQSILPDKSPGRPRSLPTTPSTTSVAALVFVARCSRVALRAVVGFFEQFALRRRWFGTAGWRARAYASGLSVQVAATPSPYWLGFPTVLDHDTSCPLPASFIFVN